MRKLLYQLFDGFVSAIALVCRLYLQWTLHRAVDALPGAKDWQLKQAEIEPDGKFHGTWFTPEAAILAEAMGEMLSEAKAENYVQVDLLPHLASRIRPIRLTVQWADGLSPAEKNAMLEAKLAETKKDLQDSTAELMLKDGLLDDLHKQNHELAALLAQVHSIGKERAAEWDRFWGAMGVVSSVITTEQAIAKWQAYERVVKAAQQSLQARNELNVHVRKCRKCKRINRICRPAIGLWEQDLLRRTVEEQAVYALDNPTPKPEAEAANVTP